MSNHKHQVAMDDDSMRGWRGRIKSHSAVVSLVALAVLVGSVVFSLTLTTPRRARPLPRPSSFETAPYHYFIDLGTNERFVASRHDAPPLGVDSQEILSDGRPAGPRARVFACGNCDAPDRQFVGYLEIYTSAAQAFLQQIVQEANEAEATPRDLTDEEKKAVKEGLLVSDTEGNHWYPHQSPQGRKLVLAPMSRCDVAAPVVECLP